jgi:uncharacterized protein YxeA
MKDHWRILTAELGFMGLIILAFLINPIVGIVVFFLDIVANGIFWYLILDFKRELDQHNFETQNSIDKEKEKYEQLSLEQYNQLQKTGYVDRGKDKQPMFVKNIYEKRNKVKIPNGRI